MKVLYVLNNIYAKGNGLNASAIRNIKMLISRGIDVKVLSGKDLEGKNDVDFPLEEFKIPIFHSLITKQGYHFAKPNKNMIIEAINWADVIHLDEPFALQRHVARYAKKLNKPCVASYHLFPQNIFCSVHLGFSIYFNSVVELYWRNKAFNKAKIIHCPSDVVKRHLEAWHYKPELRVFTNGLVLEDLMHIERKYKEKNRFNIISIGRLSVEKDLITILKALKYSKYKDKIHLTLAGQGPEKNNLKRYADRLYKKGIIKEEVSFGFYSLNELQKLALDADLYIHGAYIEVEGLSCMEAIQTGLVPIIATGKLSATSQFALSDMSKFKGRNPKDLASKIDYWLEDNRRRYDESLKYIGIGKEYDINKSIDELIKMYNDALKM